jgi:hypothetical protein
LNQYAGPAARSFSEEGEILAESLVRILTGLNQELEGLLRATTAMRPYFGENTKHGKFPHLLIQLNKALDVQGAKRFVVHEVEAKFSKTVKRTIVPLGTSTHGLLF